MRQEHTNKDRVYKTTIKLAVTFEAECWAARQEEERNLYKTDIEVGRRKDKDGSCEKCRHLERGTNAHDGRVPHREEVKMVWTCA